MGSGEDESIKALNVLIHDLRAPLSVASGYLRLIREDRLTSIEDKERALIGAIEAVRRISRLCDEASDFGALGEATETSTVLISVQDLAARVCGLLQSDGTAVDWPSVTDQGYVRVTRADRVAAAVAHLLRTCLKQLAPPEPVGVDVLADGTTLRFLAGTTSQRQQLATGEGLPFDPWRNGHGLQLPIACRDLQGVAGRVWTTAGPRSAIAVRLPLEVRTS